MKVQRHCTSGIYAADNPTWKRNDPDTTRTNEKKKRKRSRSLINVTTHSHGRREAFYDCQQLFSLCDAARSNRVWPVERTSKSVIARAKVALKCTAMLAPDLPLALAKATRFILNELCMRSEEILSDAYSSVWTDQAVVKDQSLNVTPIAITNKTHCSWPYSRVSVCNCCLRVRTTATFTKSGTTTEIRGRSFVSGSGLARWDSRDHIPMGLTNWMTHGLRNHCATIQKVLL